MKKIFAALLVSLALPAAACYAHDGACLSFGTGGTISYGFRIKICGCLRWNPCGCGGSSCCGGGGCCGYGGGDCGGGAPWYTFWPLEAHFQVPAPTGYPYWPSPMTTSLMAPPPAYGYNAATPGYQQVGYWQAPGYWYGH